ncbi:hypothetical protein PC112_g10141 [Phytophthora cactorum]|nr:hypothetical protein PC112_g10141 [Phytophthora cactorum]
MAERSFPDDMFSNSYHSDAYHPGSDHSDSDNSAANYPDSDHSDPYHPDTDHSDLDQSGTSSHDVGGMSDVSSGHTEIIRSQSSNSDSQVSDGHQVEVVDEGDGIELPGGVEAVPGSRSVNYQGYLYSFYHVCSVANHALLYDLRDDEFRKFTQAKDDKARKKQRCGTLMRNIALTRLRHSWCLRR